MKFAAGILTATSLIGLMYIGLFGGGYLTPSGLMSWSLALWVAWLIVLVIRGVARLKTGDKVGDWKGAMTFAAGFLAASTLIGFNYAGLLGGYYPTPGALWSSSFVLWLVWVVVWLIQRRNKRAVDSAKTVANRDGN